MEIKFTLLYDKPVLSGFLGGWGFSLWIDMSERNGHQYLFDTGWNRDILLHNIIKLGLKPKELTSIFISHQHWDHIGGLPGILTVMKKKGRIPNIYIPRSFSIHLKSEIGMVSKMKDFPEGIREIHKDIWTTGELGPRIWEQSLIISHPKGKIIVTGCSHPGLEKILNIVESLGSIYLIIGGFHDFQNIECLRKIPMVIPLHCTKAKKRIRSEIEGSKDLKVGEQLIID